MKTHARGTVQWCSSSLRFHLEPRRCGSHETTYREACGAVYAIFLSLQHRSDKARAAARLTVCRAGLPPFRHVESGRLDSRPTWPRALHSNPAGSTGEPACVPASKGMKSCPPVTTAASIIGSRIRRMGLVLLESAGWNGALLL
jgi:hypothetical protein